jgi:hypothetical protein
MTRKRARKRNHRCQKDQASAHACSARRAGVLIASSSGRAGTTVGNAGAFRAARISTHTLAARSDGQWAAEGAVAIWLRRSAAPLAIACVELRDGRRRFVDDARLPAWAAYRARRTTRTPPSPVLGRGHRGERRAPHAGGSRRWPRLRLFRRARRPSARWQSRRRAAECRGNSKPCGGGSTVTSFVSL